MDTARENVILFLLCFECNVYYLCSEVWAKDLFQYFFEIRWVLLGNV
jgi:hypothetical protein